VNFVFDFVDFGYDIERWYFIAVKFKQLFPVSFVVEDFELQGIGFHKNEVVALLRDHFDFIDWFRVQGFSPLVLQLLFLNFVFLVHHGGQTDESLVERIIDYFLVLIFLVFRIFIFFYFTTIINCWILIFVWIDHCNFVFESKLIQFNEISASRLVHKDVGETEDDKELSYGSLDLISEQVDNSVNAYVSYTVILALVFLVGPLLEYVAFWIYALHQIMLECDQNDGGFMPVFFILNFEHLPFGLLWKV